jgi:cytidylate kinase
MIITDPFTISLLPAQLLAADRMHPLPLLQYSLEAFFAAGVIVAGKLWMRLTIPREEVGFVAVRPAPAGLASPKPILTISREFGSGGREVGEEVARKLGYEYIDRDSIFAEIRNDGPKWEQWAKDLDEHLPSVWEEYHWSFRGFAALIQLHILEHAERGGVVIMGRGGNFLLKGVPHALRIHVTAPLDVRIERIMKRESVDRDTARWLCEKTDRERAGFLHAIYGGRWDDPAEYDEIISVEGQSLDLEVQAAMKALSQRVVTEEAKKIVLLRTVAARVKAGIATNPHFFIPVFDVLSDGEGLVIRGTTHSPKEHARIEDETKRLAGDFPVRCELHYRK